MKLNRRQRRFYFGRTEAGKRMQKLPFLHPEKVEARSQNLAAGKQAHYEFTTAIQDKLYESLAPKEAELMKDLEAKGLSKEQIDEYMEAWAGTVIWPRPDDYHALRKELNKLNKLHRVNG